MFQNDHSTRIHKWFTKLLLIHNCPGMLQASIEMCTVPCILSSAPIQVLVKFNYYPLLIKVMAPFMRSRYYRVTLAVHW